MAGIYIHIPFCKQACHYCNFHFATSIRYKPAMIRAIVRELEMRRDFPGGDACIETIYFGGGTPSLLTMSELGEIFDVIFRNYKTKLREVTLEANPDDLSEDYLKSLAQTPVDRLSIGVQSFFEEDLRWMNRAHNSQQAEQCIQMAGEAGFTNLTIDLIYGAPSTTDEMWLQNMQKAIDFGIEHISAYALTVEEKTPLHKLIRIGKSLPADPDRSATQYEMLVNTLCDAGFEQYEISNFARNRKYAVHNTSYWQGVSYLGVGPSAHSFDGRARSWNTANNQRYTKLIGEGIIPAETEILTKADMFNECIMTGLRTQWGTDIQQLESISSEYAGLFNKNIVKYLNAGQMYIHDHHCILTSSGRILADRIASDLFVV